MNFIWLLRMKRWVQNPPSPARAKFIALIIAAAAAVFALEYFGFWPDWATSERARIPAIR